MKLIRAADNWIIGKLQDAYLWLFDRSGVFLGTVGMILVTVSCLCTFVDAKTNLLRWIVVFNIAFNSICMSQFYARQAKQEYLMHNMLADFFAGSVVRILFVWFFASFAIADILIGDYFSFISDVVFGVYIYTGTIKLREREPKDWFKARETEMEFATENSK